MLSLLTAHAGTAPGDRSNADIIKSIGSSPALQAEAAELLPALERALHEPVEPDQLAVILAENAPAYGLNTKEGRPEEWAAMFRPYVDVLSEFSGDVLEMAFQAWNRGEIVSDPVAKSFYPRPPQLYEACVLARTKLASMRWRAKSASESRPAKPAAPLYRMSKAEMIEAGWLNADGSVNLAKGAAKSLDAAGSIRPHGNASPQEVAAKLRSAGVPINRGQTAAPKPPEPEPDASDVVV